MIWFALKKNLLAGARLALFLPVSAYDFRVSAVHYAVLVAFNFALWVTAAAARAGFAGDFDPSAVMVYLASVPLVLTAALLVAAAYGSPQRLLLFAIALSSSDAVFELAGLALPYVAALAGLGAAVYFLFFGLIWIVGLRVVLVCGGPRRPQLYQGALAVTAMLAIAFFIFPKVDVWQLPPEEEAGVALADERLFHAQGELMERSLVAIQPGRAGVPELYFVGFAPDASQDLYLREMRVVKRLVEERFGAEKRSITLASSHDALEEFPIASATNLSRALARVGQAMNPDEDVLFLFVAAHGDREHRLSASQPPLELARLTPTALARMLQDAGIQWRVVVLSACFSGGYLEPLRDDNSMIVTADCEAGPESNHFSAAFGEALAGSRSLAEVFDPERFKPPLSRSAAGAGIVEQLKKLADPPGKQ